MEWNKDIMADSAKDTQNGPSRYAGFFLFAFLFCLYALTMRGIPTGGDALAMFLVTHSLVEDGDTFLDGEDRVVLVPGRDGREVSKFGVAQSLAEIPGYHLGRAAAAGNNTAEDSYIIYFVTAFTSPLLGALACLFVYLASLRLGYSGRVSFGVALLAGTCTLLWPHSRLLFSEALQAMALAAAVWCGLEVREKGGAPTALAAGFFPGLVIAAKPALVFVCIPFIVYFLYGLKSDAVKRKALNAAMFFAGLGFWALVVLGYNYIRFGNIFEMGYMTIQDRETLHGFGVPLLHGLHGLLFSTGKGLLFYTPAVILSCAALPSFMKRRRAEAWLILAVFIVFILSFAKWNQWHGDYTWGPRFLVPVVPLLMLPAGEIFAPEGLFRKLWLKPVLVLIIAASFFVQILGAFVNYNEYLIVAKHQVPFDITMDVTDPGRIDLRDNMINPHYIPEFSPLMGHWWILKHTMKNRHLAKEKLNEEMRKDFPWQGLMPYAAPPDPARAVMFDCWWFYYNRYFPESAGWINKLSMSILFMGILCGILGVYTGIKGKHGE
ncbi:ArnT family glycosyltransferase [bacterium]